MGFEKVGSVWTLDSFSSYLQTITRPEWCRAVTLHHTAAPSLAQRPKGFMVSHIENLRAFYRDDLGWSSGPHLFVDEDQVFGMCDLRRKGVHAVSFNRCAIGIEVLGNYDVEDPLSGRGLACWTTATGVTRALLAWLGLTADEKTVLFHRDDPKTSKSCPGTKVNKQWLLSLLAQSIARPTTETEKPDVDMTWSTWEYRGEQWCVPVHAFLVARGVPSQTVVARLKNRNGKFYYGDELLEGAFFVRENSPLKPNGCTWAPVQELLEIT